MLTAHHNTRTTLTAGVIVLLLECCATIQPTEDSIIPPTLIDQAPLPSFQLAAAYDESSLKLQVTVSANGSVTNAEFLKATRDTAWNRLALAQIFKWKFTPATSDGRPIRTTIRFPLRIQSLDPIMLPLAEIVCENRERADSAYKAILSGEEFKNVVRRYSIASSREHDGALGVVDVRRFPAYVREELRGLKEGGVSTPLKLGIQFVIFKVVAPDS